MDIKSIVIAGGGSAGWMTASAIAKCHPDIKVTLIESKNIPIIGVGESTLTPINQFIELLGLKDHEWMPKCDAVYKLAIKYCDFSPESYYYDVLKSHRPLIVDNVPVHVMDHLLLEKMNPNVGPFCQFFDDTYDMIHENKFTNSSEKLDWDFRYDKAYHMDAYKFGLALKELVAEPNGVTHIQDDIVEIPLNELGEVACITTKEHGSITADLYIDCTGFKGLLIEGALGVPFESFNDTFMNDRAIAANIPYEDKDAELLSYTNCTALENGWMWQIPIWNRVGTGYVYSSKFVDDETALKEYKNGLRKIYGDRADNIEYRYVPFKPGVREKPWHKNVLSIGLAFGFLEPLNSTGLLVTHENVSRLIQLLEITNKRINQIDKDVFNLNAKGQLRKFKDFVLTRYALAKRDDTPYWQHVRNNVNYINSDSKTYETLAQILKQKFYNLQMDEHFNSRVLSGMNYNPITSFDIKQWTENGSLDINRLNTITAVWNDRKSQIKEYTNQLGTQAEFLRKNIYNETY
jgi:tryptophan halogenase